jgi:hypothetical protein
MLAPEALLIGGPEPVKIEAEFLSSSRLKASLRIHSNCCPVREVLTAEFLSL